MIKLGFPFSLVGSFSYFTGDGISSTTTLSFAGILIVLTVGSLTTGVPTFSVMSPVFGFTL